MKKLLTILALSTMISPVMAGNVDVKMWTKSPSGEKNVFSPNFVQINSNDTVTFISAQKSHNTTSLKRTLPKGAKKWKSKINKDLKVTFKEEGLYGYKCTPHAGLGMVGIVQVGKPVNKEKFAKGMKKIPGKGKKVMKKLFAKNVK